MKVLANYKSLNINDHHLLPDADAFPQNYSGRLINVHACVHSINNVHMQFSLHGLLGYGHLSQFVPNCH